MEEKIGETIGQLIVKGLATTPVTQVRSHLGMLGGARFGRFGTCGLSPLLLKGPRGPGRVGGGGAPRPAGL